MKITIEEAKYVQDAFKNLLEFAPDLDVSGLCYYLNYNCNYPSWINFYAIIRCLMDGSNGYIGESFGYNDDRIMFLLLFTEISPEDLHEILKQF